MKEVLLAALLSLQPWVGDAESAEDRATRLEVVAEAIEAAVLRATCQVSATGTPISGLGAGEGAAVPGSAAAVLEGAAEAEPCRRLWAGDPELLGFLLVSQARFETHLALHVHQGRCRKAECDGGRATGLWQLHAGPHLSREIWRTLAGTDLGSTSRSAWYAAVALSRGYNQCRSTEGAVGLFATGRSCHWTGAAPRARLAESLRLRFGTRPEAAPRPGAS